MEFGDDTIEEQKKQSSTNVVQSDEIEDSLDFDANERLAGTQT